jgi:hypothetical protein
MDSSLFYRAALFQRVARFYRAAVFQRVARFYRAAVFQRVARYFNAPRVSVTKSKTLAPDRLFPGTTAAGLRL